MNNSKLSILVVDDDPAVTPVYELYLSTKLGHFVEVTCSAEEAKHLVQKTLFDIAICDAKMPYKGSPLGGILLAEELSIKLGRYSVLIVSQIVNENSIREINSDLPFIKKPMNANPNEWFTKTLISKINSIIKRQFGFVAMQFGIPELDSIYKQIIRPSAKKAGFNIRRVDEEPFTRSIIDRILNSIRDSHFIVFLATNDNPNAYYEAGYAYALQKEIILCAPDLSDLPFDIRCNNSIVYKDKTVFRDALTNLLLKIRFFQ